MRRTRQEIEAVIRQRIADGTYPPGSRLPPQRDLQRELGAASVTLQRAIDRLVGHGYITLHGSQGRFIADRSPAASVFAVVIPREPNEGSWNRLWINLQREAEAQECDVGLRFRVYHISRGSMASAGHQQLCDDADAGILGGILFAVTPWEFPDSPVFRAHVPRVVIGAGDAPHIARYGASFVHLVDDSIHESILQRFARAGRRRLAAMVHIGLDACPWPDAARAAGLDVRPEWWLQLPTGQDHAACAHSVTRLLCSLPAKSRPDCLWIGDDNLVPHVTSAVREAGLQVPADLMIAAHANFPGVTLAAVPCLRFGPDVDALLRRVAGEFAYIAGGGAPRAIEIPQVVREPG